MELVNPLTAFQWTSALDIWGVPMSGIPEKQGWAFSRAGWLAAQEDPTLSADAVGKAVRQQLRPLSKTTLLEARLNYANRAVAPLPPYFIIEPTAFCNKACPFCSIHVIERFNEHGEPGNTMLHYADFEKLMCEIGTAGGAYGLSLYQLGEPMLWRERWPQGAIRNITSLVYGAKQLGRFKVVNVSTNGDVNNLDALLECDVDDVIISIDGTTEEVYLANRPSTKTDDPGAFTRTLTRVKTFLERKAQSGQPKPWVRLQIINKADTAPQVLDFIRNWLPVRGVDDVFVKQLDSMTPWLGTTVVSAAEVRLKMAKVAAMPCQHLWAVGSMTASGTFTACCHDARSELTEAGANIRTSTFTEWWHGPFMTALRAEHAGGQFRAPCASCQERDPWLG